MALGKPCGAVTPDVTRRSGSRKAAITIAAHCPCPSAVPGLPALTIPPSRRAVRTSNRMPCLGRSERGVSRPFGATGARHGGHHPDHDSV